MRILSSTALVLATLALAACGGSSDESETPDTPPDSASAPAKPDQGGLEAEGKEIFAANCASCHSLADAGAVGQVGPNLDQLMPSAATVSAIVTNGGNGMPSFSSTLSPEEIQAVSKYVSTVAGQ